MQELEDFKYEFDHNMHWSLNSDYKYADLMFIGYTFLTHFTLQEMDNYLIDKEELKEIIEDSLEEGETVTIDENNEFTLQLNFINQYIIDYVKLILMCTLTLYKDFKVENNIIKFTYIDEN